MLAVSDTGIGMDRETQARIYEPFFTTKEKGKGTGLGLATVYGIVKQSRGHILVYSEPGVGTTVKCYFPVTDAEVAAAAPAVAPARVAGQETVLVVEDEPAILSLVVSALERHGYRVLPAPDGETAMRVAAAHQGVIHLVLSDGVLSGVRVPDLLRQLRAGRPETKILLMSGYSQEAVFQNEIVPPSTAFLAKPFTVGQVAARVRGVLDAAP
jgi:CheY-like chemotaxis protein